MAASSQPPPASAPAPDFPDREALREALGLRPISYAMTTGHPDQRPCPSWCWVGRSEGFEHEIIARHPMQAMHQIDSVIRTVASLYPGEPVLGIGDRKVDTATVESDLTQLGSGDPVVSVYLRWWEDQLPQHQKRLALTLADARELAAALNSLVELANRDEREAR